MAVHERPARFRAAILTLVEEVIERVRMHFSDLDLNSPQSEELARAFGRFYRSKAEVDRLRRGGEAHTP